MPITFCKRDSPYLHWEYFNSEINQRIRIVPERGGLITEWLFNDRNILYFDHQRFSQSDLSVRGGIPILFPICGDLPDNLLPLSQGDFSLTQHGFARDIEWNIDSFDEKNGLLLTLGDTSDTYSCYPFSFLLGMRIKLLENALDISINVHNRGKVKMPFSFGLHPYFQITDLKSIEIQGLSSSCFDYQSMSISDTAHQLNQLSEGVDFSSISLEETQLLDLVTGQGIKVHYQEPMNLSVVWTDPPRSMICIEPWTSPRSAMISGERLIVLESGQSQNLRCKFSFF